MKLLMNKLQKHQINALFGLGGVFFGFLLTYSLLSYSVSQRTDKAYFIGFDEGFLKGQKVGYKQGFNTCYDEVQHNMDSISVKLTTLRILLDN